MNRTEEEELRVLRRVVSQKMSKAKHGDIRVQSVVKGITFDAFVTLTMLEVPQIESSASKDVDRLLNIAHDHASNRCVELGYKQVISVRYTGKAWEATYKL